ncbi:MAG: histidinol dehydrogenase [Nitrospiraceae bacterium]
MGTELPIISNSDRGFATALRKIVNRSRSQSATVEKSVRTILQAVERGGDRAVLRYTKKFDRLTLKPEQMRVTADEIKDAYYHIRKDEGDALRYAAERIIQFHERQRSKTWMYQEQSATLGQVITPMDAVGVYVPGGKAVYPSSVLMCAIPAKVAGVRRVVMCTPTPQGSINPYLLVAADIAGVDEIYRVGGVQAVGAMAFGTKTVAKVDKIVGPGNIFVATAKRLLYGTVGIDMVAGPSELLVVADGAADPAHVAADLLCEAEHDEDAQVYLVTTSMTLAKEAVKLIGAQLKGLQREKIASKSIARHFVALVVTTMDEAIEVANAVAPEHLTLSVDRPFDYLEQIRHAGALFLGRYTPPAVADYVAGPNHVLPTGATARFFSPLSVNDYVKVSNIVHYTKDELRKAKDHIVRLAHIEGFDAHAKSAQSRFS